MPTQGLSLLDAVQRVAEIVYRDTVAALDQGGATPAGYAQQTIEEVQEVYLASGQAGNTRYYQTITAADSKFTVPANALSVRASGPDSGRSFEIVEDEIVDVYKSGVTPTNGDTIVVDVVISLTWDQLAPTAKEVIVAEAARRLSQRHDNNPQTDAWLSQQVLTAESMTVADRPRPMPENSFVFSRGLAATQQQGEQPR